jgi:hypothetical protein
LSSAAWAAKGNYRLPLSFVGKPLVSNTIPFYGLTLRRRNLFDKDLLPAPSASLRAVI